MMYENQEAYKLKKKEFQQEEAKFKAIHEADTVFELRPPREPTQAEENEYIDW